MKRLFAVMLTASSLAIGLPAAAQSGPGAAGASPAAAPAGGPQSANIFESASDHARAQVARQAEQPLNNAPVWRDVNNGKAHFTNVPDREAGVLIQKGGEEWRQLRNGPITQYGGWGLVAVLVLIAAFYLLRGPIRLSEPPSGRMIERFTLIERCIHWTNAGCFVVLGLTGLIMLFGKHLLLPVFGYTLFAALASVGKTAHNFIGPLFAVTTIVVFLTFVRDNLPRLKDLAWLARGGGLLTGAHIRSDRFNAGEKVLFWGGVVALGVTVAITGFVLDFPNFQQTRGDMQFAWTIHVIGSLCFIALILGHIYIGTVGTEGALDAMKTGYVDETWAREHHEDWYDDIKSGRLPAQRSGEVSTSTASAQARA